MIAVHLIPLFLNPDPGTNPIPYLHPHLAPAPTSGAGVKSFDEINGDDLEEDRSKVVLYGRPRC